ncbi:MAG: hypothetical protein RR626_00755, partial [Anaerovoracaceae bacterium]
TPRRGDQIDPSKETTCWIIPIENFSLEPGCMYEFGFRRGMIANNGISLVLAEDNTGYLKQPFTGEEQARYDQYKEEEYKFVASRDGTNLNLVPMRFTVQTYADLSIWSEAEAEAVNFLSTVTEADLDKGRYNRENVEALRGHLSSLQAQVETGAKMELQGQSNITQKRLAQELRATLAQAKVEKPIEADLTALTAKIKEAKEFYEKAKKNVGIELGQYGEEAVNALNTEIGVAQAMHKFTRQEEIDAEIVNLESAMIRVKSSVVREPYVTFRDKATGLVVIAPIAAFPANAQMIVRRANQASEAYKNAVKNLSKEETEATLYIIEFYSGINLVQPEKEITIQIPTEEKMKNFLTTLYFADAKGKLEEIKAPEINGMKMFTDNKVGTYLVSGREKPKTEEKDQKTETMTIMREDPLPKEPEEKETEIEKEKEKKEEIVNPIDEYRKKVENDAKFDHNAVTRDASPVYLLVVAMILAVAAVGVGARAMLKGRKKDD